jgi:hypothetical protein
MTMVAADLTLLILPMAKTRNSHPNYSKNAPKFPVLSTVQIASSPRSLEPSSDELVGQIWKFKSSFPEKEV